VRLTEEERGITLIELLIVMVLMGILLGGLANVLVSGTRAQYDMDSRLNAQQSARGALDRIEYEGRCSTSATIVNSGAGVTFSLPSQCTHASGTVTWCVVSGILKRFTTAGCTGTGMIFVRYLTSATPFSLHTVTGNLPQLVANLVTNPTSAAANRFAITDSITLRNSSPS
jgi:prepilin-type N-terminal cleavage/methylation domain-containing protein